MKLSQKKESMARKMYAQADAKTGSGAPAAPSYKNKKGKLSVNSHGKNMGETKYLGKNEQQPA